MPAVSRGRYLLFAALACGGCTFDLATKHWAFRHFGTAEGHQTRWVLDGILGFTTNLNEGALFGFGQGRGIAFGTLSIAAIVGILAWLFVAGAARDRWLTIAVGLVAGGILGNLYDRLGLPGLTWGPQSSHEPGAPVYAVRDWIHFRIEGLIDWPIFNIADSLLICGALLLIAHALTTQRGRSEPHREPSTSA